MKSHLNQTIKNKYQHSAFTIVELLIVIVVIGILAAITIVSYSGISSQANVATIKSDLDTNNRKLQLYYTKYGSYPTALDGSNCPSAPTVDSNYCLKLSPGNTVSAYTGTSSTFNLKIAKGTVVYQITPDTGPQSSNAPIIASNYSGYDLLFCRYASDCSGVTGISSDFSYQVTFTAKAGSKYSVSMIQIDNTSTSWTTGTTISANITYSTPTAGASLASNIITTTNAGSTAITFTGTGTLDKTVFVKLTEVDGSNNPVSDSAYTKALGAYTTVGSYTLNSPVNGAVNYLVIAGGGGGDFNGSGGGGAGGYRTTVGTSGGGASAETVLNLASSTAYSVVVGAGGGVAINGSNSSLATIASIGGGAGINGGSGNSGGSGAGTDSPTSSVGSGTSGQGYSGGSTTIGDDGGGGGGAGGAGANATSTIGGNGGVGQTSILTGTSVCRAGGGGGGTHWSGASGNTTATCGGSNGGIRGSSTAAPNATASTGGGGGGGGGTSGSISASGGSGASGIVIFRLQ